MTQRDAFWRLPRLSEARLYLCLGLRRERGDLEPFLDAVLVSGVDVVQMREKDATHDELCTAAALFRAASRRHGALFMVNDDPSLAVELDADGVHVGQEDPPPHEARAIVGRDRLVGRSTHSVSQIRRALGEDCDYFAVGPVHATPTKAGRTPVGLEPVRYAAHSAGTRPRFVTGAMGTATAPAVIEAGARRLVVVRAITEADTPATIVGRLAAMLRDPALTSVAPDSLR